MSLKDSPYYIAYYQDGSIEMCFTIDGKDAIKLNLDRDNRYKLAIDLLMPYNYKPEMEKFIVSRCQSQ